MSFLILYFAIGLVVSAAFAIFDYRDSYRARQLAIRDGVPPELVVYDFRGFVGAFLITTLFWPVIGAANIWAWLME